MLEALYGCEVAPANEVSFRTLRTSISKTIAYTTSQRSADLTFAVASYGPDLDPDVHIFSRRAVVFRRYITRNEEHAKNMKETFEAYARKKGTWCVYQRGAAGTKEARRSTCDG